MFRTLDRYILRELVPPFVIALVVFTFTLQLHPMRTIAEPLIARGVPWAAVLRLLSLILPVTLALTIPMALLVAVLVAFGRLSADREYVACQSCGISVFRLLRPALLAGVVCWAATSYITQVAKPAAVQAFLGMTFRLVTTHVESEIRPREFVTALPGRTLYAREVSPSGWTDVFLADESEPNRTAVSIARRGRLIVDANRLTASLVLEDGATHRIPPDRTGAYELNAFDRVVVDVDWPSMFPRRLLTRSENDMTVAELRQTIDGLHARGADDTRARMAMQQLFSIPVACLVFTVLGVALGASTGRGGRTGSFVCGVAIIFVYYITTFTGRALAVNGWLSAEIAMWAADVVIGAGGLLLLVRRSRGPAGDLQAPPGARAIQAFVRRWRWPGWRLRIPGLRTLDRYVAGMYVQVFLVSAVALAGIAYISLFMDLSADVFGNAGTIRLLGPYFAYQAPQIAYYTIPIAVLMATLVTIGLLTRHSEIVVMKACGVSLYRVALPLLLLAIASSAALYGVQELWLADANRRAEAVRQVIRGQPARSFDPLDRRWTVGRIGTIYHYLGIDRDRGALRNLSMFELDPDQWRLRRRTVAAEAVYVPGNHSAYEWVATSGTRWTFDATGAPVGAVPLVRASLALEPLRYFKTDWPEADRMTYRELSRLIVDLRTGGMNVTPYVVRLRRKLSFPFVTIIMTLIAVPFAVTTGRRGALHGIGIGVGLAFGYWAAVSAFAALGNGGVIAPALAAWAPNILFGTVALYLLLTTRT